PAVGAPVRVPALLIRAGSVSDGSLETVAYTSGADGEANPSSAPSLPIVTIASPVVFPLRTRRPFMKRLVYIALLALLFLSSGRAEPLDKPKTGPAPPAVKTAAVAGEKWTVED